MINIELLERTLIEITEHPEKHNQRTWAMRTPCGTSGCLAGNALMLQGYEIVWYQEEQDLEAATQVYTEEEEASIRYMAQVELGLEEDDADALFDAKNTIADLWRIANDITDGEIKIPEKFLTPDVSVDD